MYKCNTLYNVQLIHMVKSISVYNRNLCKKVTGKKISEKNLEIKTLVKKSQFSEVLGQNVTGNEVLSFKRYR